MTRATARQRTSTRRSFTDKSINVSKPVISNNKEAIG